MQQSSPPVSGLSATLDMNTPCGAKSGQVDGQSLRTVAGTPSHDKENDECLSNPTGFGQDLLLLTFLHLTSTAKRTTRQPVSSTRQAQPAFPRWYTSQGISAFPMELISTQPLPYISIRAGCHFVSMHLRGQSDNNRPVESVVRHSSASTISLEVSLQLLTSWIFRGCQCYPGSEEGKTSRSPGSRRFSRKE
jgi:hypothetical protein